MEVDLKLSQQQIIQILNILSTQPYGQVAELIALIHSQVNKPKAV